MSRLCTILSMLTLVLGGLWTSAQAQVTRGARERVQDRIERRTERQLNRIDRGFYFNDAAWSEVQPWINKYEITGFVDARTGTPVRAQTQTRFGFTDADKADDWYYDFYDPGYSVLYPAQANATGVYGVQYFDSNGDGIYDVYYNVYDKDSDGVFDEQEEYRFGTTTAKTSEPSTNEQSTNEYTHFQSSQSVEITGEVIAIKRAQVRGDEHIVLHVRKADSTEIPVDVGHANHLKVKINVGDRVVVKGYMVTMGDRNLLISDHIEVNSERVDVQRTSEPLTGVIVETRNVTLHDQEHTLVVLDVDGKHRLIDVGPTANVEFEYKPQTQLTVYGVPVQINEGQMLMASRVQYNDRTLPVIRRAMRR